jgi:hypothetical protein
MSRLFGERLGEGCALPKIPHPPIFQIDTNPTVGVSFANAPGVFESLRSPKMWGLTALGRA